MPAKLTVAAFTCTGSEANDLALRMARTVTGAKDVITLDWAYHGHTQALIDVSPYKYKRKGGKGRPDTTWEVPLPDAYRAPADWPRAEIGARYAAAVGERRGEARQRRAQAGGLHRRIAAELGGQIVLPEGYLKAALRRGARGRRRRASPTRCRSASAASASHLWAFETQGVVPDIVTMGKPIGNGHPMAALVTTRGDRRRLRQRHGVLQHLRRQSGVLRRGPEGAGDHRARPPAARTRRTIGAYLLDGMRALMDRHEVIGDVRGLRADAGA